MAYDLFGVSHTAHYPWYVWKQLLEIAWEFGWRPEGTIPPDDHDVDSWDGTDYFSNANQAVTTSDAAAMALALFRASAAKRSGTLTEKQLELLAGVPLSEIEELAELASCGNFNIA